MKENNGSQAYRNLGFDKIDAPKKGKKGEPKSTRTDGGDLRIKGKK